MSTNVAKQLCMLALALAAVMGCGGGASSELTCAIAESALGPYSPDTPLGATMTEELAQARMNQDGVQGWLAITASGDWEPAWDIAGERLGGGIHTDLAWLDIDGSINGLHADGDRYGFTDLRVSRSFQGKIERSDDPLFIGLSADDGETNFDATCEITSLRVGTPAQPTALELLHLLPETAG